MTDSRTPNSTPADPAAATPQTKIVSMGDEPSRGEVSAATIGRMLGLASMRELNLLEGKLDLVMSKINSLVVKLDKVVAVLGNSPTGKDLERIDVQIAALRTQLQDTGSVKSADSDTAATSGASKRAKIVSNEAPPTSDTNTTPKA